MWWLVLRTKWHTKQRRTKHKHTAAASTKPKPSHFDVNQAEQRLTSPKNEKQSVKRGFLKISLSINKRLHLPFDIMEHTFLCFALITMNDNIHLELNLINCRTLGQFVDYSPQSRSIPTCKSPIYQPIPFRDMIEHQAHIRDLPPNCCGKWTFKEQVVSTLLKYL